MQCAAVYEKTVGWGGGACSLYSSESSLSLQAVQPDYQDFNPAVPTCLTLTATDSQALHVQENQAFFFVFVFLPEGGL